MVGTALGDNAHGRRDLIIADSQLNFIACYQISDQLIRRKLDWNRKTLSERSSEDAQQEPL